MCISVYALEVGKSIKSLFKSACVVYVNVFVCIIISVPILSFQVNRKSYWSCKYEGCPECKFLRARFSSYTGFFNDISLHSRFRCKLLANVPFDHFLTFFLVFLISEILREAKDFRCLITVLNLFALDLLY